MLLSCVRSELYMHNIIPTHPVGTLFHPGTLFFDLLENVEICLLRQGLARLFPRSSVGPSYNHLTKH